MYRRIISIFFILSLCFCANTYAQTMANDPTAITQEINYHLDGLGDGKMEINMKMTASQWQAFKASTAATNLSIFKRDMERQLAGYLLEDFKSDLDEMNRTSKISLTGRGMAVYKGSGKWEIKLGAKNPNVTKVSDNCYLLTGNISQNGAVIQQLQKIFFPEGATDIKQDTDTFGNAIFKYEYDAEPSSMNGYLIAGSVLVLASGGLFAMGRRGNKVKA